jgi:hypothetical protein
MKPKPCYRKEKKPKRASQNTKSRTAIMHNNGKLDK